jgi:hypothetical protein
LYIYRKKKELFMARTTLQLVKEVSGSMAIEGLELQNEEIDMLQLCAAGKVTTESLLESLIRKHNQCKTK